MFNKDDLNVEIQAVKKAIRENKSLRMHKRYMVILHHLKEHQNCEIAEMEFYVDTLLENILIITINTVMMG